jgi:hypothetical protein
MLCAMPALFTNLIFLLPTTSVTFGVSIMLSLLVVNKGVYNCLGFFTSTFTVN